MSALEIQTTISDVTVYPDQARVTRRGRVRLAPGEHRVRIAPLPWGLRRDSLRVGGRGSATVLGVDVSTWHRAQRAEEQIRVLEQRRQDLSDDLAELDDLDGVEAQRADFLTQLAQRAGGTYARALATGDAVPEDVTTFADSVAAQLRDGRSRRRALHRRRAELTGEREAVERQIQARQGEHQPDRLVAEVSVVVDAGDEAAEAELELTLTYVVGGARWQPSYDLRLVEEKLTVTWFGLVSQETGEDWPECALQLSTARPAASTSVPEVAPWYLDRVRPVVPPMPLPPAPMAAPGALPVGGGGPARAKSAVPPPVAAPAPPVRQRVADVEQGTVAATYRLARPVAVPADGSAHRATVAVLDLPARLDHVTVPLRSADVHLRVTVTNGSALTLSSGPAAIFHGTDFVGTTRLPMWAPGEEIELALGVDDRVRVERRLTRRADTRATLGSTRRREVEYTITVGNHTPGPVTVEVRDQLPVSRDEGIVVRETVLRPAPAGRTELGEVTWRLALPPGGDGQVTMGFRVEIARGVDLAGWRD